MPDPMIRETPPNTGGGNALTRPMMGLPTWAWVALAAAGGAVFFIWRSRGKSDTPATTSATPVDGEAQGLEVEQYESLLALLRDIQGEVSTGEDGDTTPPATTSPPPAKTPSAPPPKPKPKPSHKVVTVVPYTKTNTKWNATLSGIASHEHTTVAKLMKLNPGIKNANIVHPGQKVVVS